MIRTCLLDGASIGQRKPAHLGLTIGAQATGLRLNTVVCDQSAFAFGLGNKGTPRLHPKEGRSLKNMSQRTGPQGPFCRPLS